MSLIDRAEARRKPALAAMDSSERAALGQYLTPYQTVADLAWETESWCAVSPTHMIHLHADRLLGPQEVSASVIAKEHGE